MYNQSIACSICFVHATHTCFEQLSTGAGRRAWCLYRTDHNSIRQGCMSASNKWKLPDSCDCASVYMPCTRSLGRALERDGKLELYCL